DITSHDPDVIMLQEISRTNVGLLAVLRSAYPHQTYCPGNGRFGTAVLSKWPTSGVQHCTDRTTITQLSTPWGDVWTVSLHLYWPFPMGQSDQLRSIMPQLSALDGPVILAGDLNMLPTTRVDRVLAQSTQTRSLRPTPPTFFVGPIPLSIDRIFAKCGKVRQAALAGSDHHGIVAHVGFNTVTCPNAS
ncbi:MAG: endonuclease/exonuclease/phosphatase family protein, partial [Pseudomonadota bacterium]